MSARSWIALAVVLFAVRADAAETWTYASSDHFEVYTTDGAGTARRSLNHFERVHDFLTRTLDLKPRLQTPTRLIIFSSHKQFSPYSPNDVAAAFYLDGADRDYIVMERFDEESTPIVAHEYMHLLLKDSRARFPVWLNEGLAEVFSTVSPEGGVMTIGKVPRDRLDYLRSGVGLIDVARLFVVEQDSPEYNTRTHAGVFYSESWALAHMLMLDDRYRAGWPAFRDKTAKGVPGADALMEVYKKSPEALGRDLSNYISRDQYIYARSTYKTSNAETKYETRAADPFEGNLVTANLLASSPGSEAAARSAFDTLEAQKPSDTALLEARAAFELNHGHVIAASAYLGRAVEQGSRNAAMMLTIAQLDPASAATLLPKALAIAPDDADIRIENARLMLHDRRSADAARLLAGMTNLDRPQQFDRAQILANAYLQLNRVSDAREAAAVLASSAADGTQAAFAARVARSIDEYEKQRDAIEQPQTRSAVTGTSVAPAADAPETPRTGTPPSLATLGSSPDRGFVTVEGRIRNVVCQRGETTVEVLAGGQTLRLFIDNGNAIRVLGQTGFTVDLKCGAQDAKITVGYEPRIDPARKTVGHIRVLDYR